MKFLSVVLTFIASAAIPLGCSPPPDKAEEQINVTPLNVSKTNIKWDGPLKLDAANYYIDGKKIGVGLKGFDQIVEYMALLNSSAKVTIEVPKTWTEAQWEDTANSAWDFPFEGFPERRKAFERLCVAKSFVLLFK